MTPRIRVYVHWPEEDTGEHFEIVSITAGTLTAALLPGTDIVGLEPGDEVEFLRADDGSWHEDGDGDDETVLITLA